MGGGGGHSGVLFLPRFVSSMVSGQSLYSSESEFLALWKGTELALGTTDVSGWIIFWCVSDFTHASCTSVSPICEIGLIMAETSWEFL